MCHSPILIRTSRFRGSLGLVLLLYSVVALGGQTFAATPSSPRYKLVPHTHTGICDASGVVALDATTVAVVDDEHNEILVYDVGRSGPARFSVDVSRFLAVDENHPEVDLEGGTRVGNIIYWISSHGRNRKAKKRDSRYRFFATQISSDQDRIQLEPKGVAYNRLLHDLMDDSRYAEFGLKQASKQAPKSDDALNIEGITDAPNGDLLIGFRNPVPNGKALIATLTNPARVIQGMRAIFSDPIVLDLGGNGIRGMASSAGNYLIIAGPTGSGGESMLYRWKGLNSKLTRISGIDFGDLNPEAVTFLPSVPRRVLLLSDDGTRKVGGQACKELTDQSQKRFRSLIIQQKE